MNIKGELVRKYIEEQLKPKAQLKGRIQRQRIIARIRSLKTRPYNEQVKG